MLVAVNFINQGVDTEEICLKNLHFYGFNPEVAIKLYGFSFDIALKL